MSKINKEFVLKYIEEIKAFCEGNEVESRLEGNIIFKWHLLNESKLSNIISNDEGLLDYQLRIKPKKKFVYINSWIDNSGDFQHEFKSEYNSSKEAVNRYCYKIDIDYLSVAVKTEVDNE